MGKRLQSKQVIVNGKEKASSPLEVITLYYSAVFILIRLFIIYFSFWIR